LKDVQHERIFQLALEGAESFPPLKTEAPKSASDELGERIERHVEEMIGQSFKPGKAKKPKPHDSLRWTVIGLIELVLVVLTIVVIIWLIRHIL
jgi:hypothetical protein